MEQKKTTLNCSEFCHAFQYTEFGVYVWFLFRNDCMQSDLNYLNRKTMIAH